MENPAPLRQNLVDLLNKPATPIITKAIEREIARFPFRADLHSPAVQQKLSEWATKTFVAPAQKKPILSIGLIVLNVMMFLLTTGWNGELQMQAAYDMGIVVYPEMAQTGEWWRLITANFLHANWIHLLMNMLGILFIGVDLERHLGIWRYGLIYLASGIGTMAVGIVIYSWFDQGNDPFMALGASGAIFGLLGGFAVLSWHRWRHDHAEKGKQALKAVFLMIAIQSVFDFLYLEGSSTLHIAGFITGILVSLVVLPPAFRRRLFTDS
jgi:rhomboid protease GluP